MERRHTAAHAIIHWLLLGEALVLVVTGSYLHNPFIGAPHGLSVFVHVSTGYLMLSTVGFRLYWLILGEPPDWRAEMKMLAQRDWSALSRYLIYVLLWITLAGLALTGLALRFPTSGFYAGVVHRLGGVVAVRITHYLLAWLFVSALLLHTYQPLLHGLRYFTAIFVPTGARAHGQDNSGVRSGAGP